MDIDGAYPSSRNDWIRPSNTLVCGLTEADLYQLTKVGSGFSDARWHAETEQAVAVVNGYLLPKIAAM